MISSANPPSPSQAAPCPTRVSLARTSWEIAPPPPLRHRTLPGPAYSVGCAGSSAPASRLVGLTGEQAPNTIDEGPRSIVCEGASPTLHVSDREAAGVERCWRCKAKASQRGGAKTRLGNSAKMPTYASCPAKKLEEIKIHIRWYSYRIRIVFVSYNRSRARH